MTQQTNGKKLMSLDDLFDDVESPNSNKGNSKVEIDIELLIPFLRHPFKLYTGQRLDDMVRSIEEFGILQPLIVRPFSADTTKYEILAGHNRWNSAVKVGLKKVPVIIMEGLSDDEAMLVVIETNLIQRSFADLSYSERALILSEHYDALKSQGRRVDIINQIKMLLDASEINDSETCGHDVHKLKSREKVGEEYNLDGRTVARYLRINMLNDEIKKFIDDKIISFTAGVELSYLSEDNQIYLVDILNNNNYKVSPEKATELKKLQENNKLNEVIIMKVLEGTYSKPKKQSTVLNGIKVAPKIMKKYFNERQSTEEVENIIDKALELYYQSLK